MTNKDSDSSKKFSAAVERLAKLRLKVTDGTCKGKAIGFVGGVRLPKEKSMTAIIPLVVRNRRGKDGQSRKPELSDNAAIASSMP